METRICEFASDFYTVRDMKNFVRELLTLTTEKKAVFKREVRENYQILTDPKESASRGTHFSLMIGDHYLLPDNRRIKVFFPHGLERAKMILCPTSREGNDIDTDAATSGRNISDWRSVASLQDSGEKNDRETTTESERPDFLFFVAFVGFAKAETQKNESLSKENWQVDAELREEMRRIPDIEAYISCERSVGGDWSNLVLFTSEDAVKQWRVSIVHHEAVRIISPKYYSTVRIHGGQLEKGISSEMFLLDRTIFLDYNDTNNMQRKLRKWTKADLPEPVFLISVKQ